MSSPPPARAGRLAALRAEIHAIAPDTRRATSRLGFGIAALDDRLAGLGLATDGLHEVAAGTTHLGDDAAASLFAAGLAARVSAAGTVLWILSRTDLFAPGLAQAGLAPARLLQVDAGRDEDALAIMEDGLRHGGLAAVVCEVSSKADLTATRRLQLAAEEGGTMALLLRRWKRMRSDPLTSPSAAMTRWRIRCAPSAPLPVAGVGRPCWDVELVRQRGGDPCHWLLEGCDASGRLALPAEPRHGSAAPAPTVRRRRQAA